VPAEAGQAVRRLLGGHVLQSLALVGHGVNLV